MIKRLKIIPLCWMVIFLLGVLIQPAFADDSSKDNKTISLTINWLDDTSKDRPESITIELYRSVDGQEYPMDSKVLTSANGVSSNCWKTSFTYYYGEVWEYAFKILGTEPTTGLYNYQLLESGNGTNQYTFDFLYGHGQTEMTIIAEWEDDTDSLDERPESITVDLISLEGDQVPERSVILTGKADDNKWSATVSGLDYDPSSYYIVVKNLPKTYSNLITRGEESNIYVSTNTYVGEVIEGSMTPSSDLSSIINGFSETVSVNNKSLSNGVINNFWLNLLILVLIVVLSGLAILKHRELVRKKNNTRGKRNA